MEPVVLKTTEIDVATKYLAQENNYIPYMMRKLVPSYTNQVSKPE